VRKTAILVVALLVAAEAGAATVVLVGGKRLDVASYTIGGSYVVVEYANGRRESYPLSVVDLGATREAAGAKPTPAAVQPEGPHSPFLGAKSSGGTGGVVVTDADVQHLEPTPEGGAGEEAKEAGPDESATQVTLVSYEKKKVGEGEWDIVATLANQGKTPVHGVSAMMRVLDDQGKPVATGSGSVPGTIEPGKQATVTARVSLQGEPFQVAVDLSWQQVRPTVAPAASPGAGKPQTSPPPPAKASSLPPDGWTVPAGSPPGTLPRNPMAVPRPNAVGAAPQVPRGEPK